LHRARLRIEMFRGGQLRRRFWTAVASAARHRFRTCVTTERGLTSRTRRSVSKAPSPLPLCRHSPKRPRPILDCVIRIVPFRHGLLLRRRFSSRATVVGIVVPVIIVVGGARIAGLFHPPLELCAKLLLDLRKLGLPGQVANLVRIFSDVVKLLRGPFPKTKLE